MLYLLRLVISPGSRQRLKSVLNSLGSPPSITRVTQVSGFSCLALMNPCNVPK